ncbi:unnamed protein product [Effrenium voratum]|uniref:Uncharacterized protein n=1 Tax=Effrenium voratum TaxID=2562239 RepID=A0AA36MN08_9DINO|nr:unnamed protein product [Effrenium voratum]CAJ1427788.1 unnamed protein product [Effrenium voratum]
MGTLEGSDDPAVDQAVVELDDEEKDFWRQLRRKRDFEARIDEKRAQIEALHKKRQSTRVAREEASVSVDLLIKEAEFVKSQQRELEHDLAVLQESNRLQSLQATDKSQRYKERASPSRTKDFLAEERVHMESLQAQQDQITHLRMHIESLHVEKQSLQQKQEVLFHKQRSAEQDRNRLLGSLQDDRNTLNEVRSERIRLSEERTNLEKQIASVVNKVHESVNEPHDRLRWSPERRMNAPAAEAKSLFKVPGSFGGVRGDVPYDAILQEPVQPVHFATVQESPRPHWTAFDKEDLRNKAAESPSFGSFRTLRTA